MGKSIAKMSQNRTNRGAGSSERGASVPDDRESLKDECCEGIPSPSFKELQEKILEYLISLEVHKRDRTGSPPSDRTLATAPTRGATLEETLRTMSSLFPHVDEHLIAEAHGDLFDDGRIYDDQARSCDSEATVFRACTTTALEPRSERIEERPPRDLRTAYLAVTHFHVSRATLLRALRAGKLRFFRAPNAERNAPHLFSEAELATLYGLRRK